LEGSDELLRSRGQDVTQRGWLQRRIAPEQLVIVAHALGTTLDQLVEPENDEDELIRPEAEFMDGATLWLPSREQDRRGVVIAKMRIIPERDLEGLQCTRATSNSPCYWALSTSILVIR